MEEYNQQHGITPVSIRKSIRAGIEAEVAAHVRWNADAVGRTDDAQYITGRKYIAELEAEMFAAAEALEFERAASIRDRIEKMRDAVGKKVEEVNIREKNERKGRRGGGGRVPRPKRAI